ncbi:hypothetical protein [Actinomadura nitritigenes]|uniref:hypothetical protein n=1 Tax=Actinomadura nitritigenes TaxID=134602 RepID=UPI003D92F288
MNVFGSPVVYVLAMLALGVECQIGVLVALALVLRGSAPEQRPRLLAAFAQCLPYVAVPYALLRPAFPHRRTGPAARTRSDG